MTIIKSARIITIIDDDEGVRDSTRMLLEFFGYSVRDYDCAERFLASGSREGDCLLVDQHMPGMSGVELLEFLDRNGERPPALLVTARADSNLEARLARLGVKLVHKPVMDDELIELIEAACQSRTALGTPGISQKHTQSYSAAVSDPLNVDTERHTSSRKSN